MALLIRPREGSIRGDSAESITHLAGQLRPLLEDLAAPLAGHQEAPQHVPGPVGADWRRIRMPARLQILSLLVGLSVLWMTSEGGVEVLCLIVVIMAWVLLS